jgi:hypothetical protein
MVSDNKPLKRLEKNLEGKFLDKDEVKRRQQVDDVFLKLSPAVEQEWTLEKMNAVAYLLDELPKQQNYHYKGITLRRTKDKRWKKLFNELTEIEIDNSAIFGNEKTKKMVNDYIAHSYVGSSVLLFTQLFNNYIPTGLLPTEYITNEAHNPEIAIENRMTELLTKLDKRIMGAIEKDNPIIEEEVNGYRLKINNWGECAKFSANINILNDPMAYHTGESLSGYWEKAQSYESEIMRDNDDTILIAERDKDIPPTNPPTMGFIVFFYDRQSRQLNSWKSTLWYYNPKSPVLPPEYDIEVSITANPSLVQPFIKRYKLSLVGLTEVSG